jgi:RNA polymerase sigma-70 factor (ECF subfamily)
VGARELALGRVGAPVAGEALLLSRCREGDPQAFARLVALHERMVLDLASRLLGDPEEAKDLAQEVFLQVYKMLGSFEARSSLKTWIYRIVVNRCRNRLRFWRRRRREKSLPIEELLPGQEAKLAEANPGSDPLQSIERREVGEQVQRALARLSFNHRALLLLREADELSCAQIAEALGVREGTVKSRLARAREALRRELEPLLPGGTR